MQDELLYSDAAGIAKCQLFLPAAITKATQAGMVHVWVAGKTE